MSPAEEQAASKKGIDLGEVDRIVARVGGQPRHVIPILTAIQKKYNYLPREAMERVCETTAITPAAISSVASFYTSFRLSPAGRHIVKVCIGTACHVKGAGRVKEAILRHLKVDEGGDTDDGRVFTVTEVACLGCCTLAPAVQIDDVTYGHLNPGNVGDMLEDFLTQQKKRSGVGGEGRAVSEGELDGEIRIALGSCCVAGGSARVMESIERQVERYRLPVRLREVACFGMCHQTPLVEVVERGGNPPCTRKLTRRRRKVLFLRTSGRPRSSVAWRAGLTLCSTPCFRASASGRSLHATSRSQVQNST
ncbi:MAG: NAD(P)H-dependent oxidoreductase subunit E [Victivallales bacterium]|nr:NAD(P)H-dependent oxidoreductase subunit E [Victivallales bacterium]